MKTLLKIILRLRWWYFHINPYYKKFYMTETEAHFWHSRTNTIHSDFTVE